eukprot:6142767-Prorocentrum_lima.AAC.1
MRLRAAVHGGCRAKHGRRLQVRCRPRRKRGLGVVGRDDPKKQKMGPPCRCSVGLQPGQSLWQFVRV